MLLGGCRNEYLHVIFTPENKLFYVPLHLKQPKRKHLFLPVLVEGWPLFPSLLTSYSLVPFHFPFSPTQAGRLAVSIAELNKYPQVASSLTSASQRSILPTDYEKPKRSLSLRRFCSQFAQLFLITLVNSIDNC